MMILLGFAPNPANPRKILWWLCCYAWWPDEFLGNFSFVVIIKKSSHFPYSNRYPKTFAPNFKSSYINENENRIEYAKAIMYQTGGFFEGLLGESINPSILMVYTSDHGQNLNDASVMPHCSASGEPYQGDGMVPMLIIDNKNNEQTLS
jgi:glucan phosphoethanolaminetransferase (alkaline phosphatase superfamily)